MLMALAVELDMQVYQLDFVSAYLNGDIKGNIYMEVPEVFSVRKNGRNIKEIKS